MLLMECLSSASSPYVLNYDIRSRNTPMESSREAARDALNATIERLRDVVPNARMADPIALHAVTPYPQVVQTTFGREVLLLHDVGFCPLIFPSSYGLQGCMRSTIGLWSVRCLSMSYIVAHECRAYAGPGHCWRDGAHDDDDDDGWPTAEAR